MIKKENTCVRYAPRARIKEVVGSLLVNTLVH